MLRDASSLRIRLIAVDFESTHPFVNQMEIALNLVKGVIENTLITGDCVSFAVDFTPVRSYSVLASLQLRYVSYNSVPDWTRVVKSCLKLLVETAKPAVNISNPRYEIIYRTANIRFQFIDSCEDHIRIGCW